MLQTAAENSIFLKQIDYTQPLGPQGPFDIIIHKLRPNLGVLPLQALGIVLADMTAPTNTRLACITTIRRKVQRSRRAAVGTQQLQHHRVTAHDQQHRQPVCDAAAQQPDICCGLHNPPHRHLIISAPLQSCIVECFPSMIWAPAAVHPPSHASQHAALLTACCCFLHCVPDCTLCLRLCPLQTGSSSCVSMWQTTPKWWWWIGWTRSGSCTTGPLCSGPYRALAYS